MTSSQNTKLGLEHGECQPREPETVSNAPPSDEKPRIPGLDALIEAAKGDRLPPVDRWDPPYCGDIGMAIRGDGTWFYQGSPIGRKPMVKLFSRILRRDADGRHFLVTPVEKVDVTVADAPFLAVEMDVRGARDTQVLTFRTNVDDVVSCGREHPLRFIAEAAGGGSKPYLLVRGRLEALVTRAVYYDLMELVVDREGETGVWSGGVFWKVA
jgi:hypothetical protein